MMIIDKILDWARGSGYTAVYGSAGQINEMLTDVDFAASKDATAVIMHLVTDSATVNGKDTAVVAVYFASLCDFDFDGEQLLPEQERLKGIGKELLNDIRTGNEMTYSDPRWQYGYDDYAENICWVCLRVTLTASAADCVPLSPEPPAPPPEPEYDIFCPQIIEIGRPYNGSSNPIFYRDTYSVSIALSDFNTSWLYSSIPFVGVRPVRTMTRSLTKLITPQSIEDWKSILRGIGNPMTPQTESWLRDRINRTLLTIKVYFPEGESHILVAENATHFESKPVTVYE